jgi:hypothetical protein
VHKFQGYFEEVERRHPSGVSFHEHVRNPFVLKIRHGSIH